MPQTPRRAAATSVSLRCNVSRLSCWIDYGLSADAKLGFLRVFLCGNLQAALAGSGVRSMFSSTPRQTVSRSFVRMSTSPRCKRRWALRKPRRRRPQTRLSTRSMSTSRLPAVSEACRHQDKSFWRTRVGTEGKVRARPVPLAGHGPRLPSDANIASVGSGCWPAGIDTSCRQSLSVRRAAHGTIGTVGTMVPVGEGRPEASSAGREPGQPAAPSRGPLHPAGPWSRRSRAGQSSSMSSPPARGQ